MRKTACLVVVFTFALLFLGLAPAFANGTANPYQDSPAIHKADSLTALGLYTDALVVLRKGLSESIAQSNSAILIKTLLKIGVNLELSGRYEESFQALLTALNMSEKNGISDFVAEINLNIGIVYFDMNQPERAKMYYSKAYEVALSHDDTLGMIRALNNAGNVYLTLQNNGDSALMYFLPAYRLAELVEYSTAMMAIGGNIAQLYMLQNEFEKADQLAVRLMKIDSLNPYLLLTRAMVLKNANRFSEAAEMCLYTLELTDNPEFQMALLQELAQLSISLAEPQKAFDYLSQYSALKDSLNSVDIAKHISSVEAEYENEKKLRKIEQLETESLITEKRIQRLSFLLFAVVLIAAGVVFWFRGKKKLAAQKLELEKQRLKRLQAESETKMAQSYIAGEESERERLSGELHDGLGGLLTGIRLQVDAFMAKDSGENKELSLVADNILNAATELRRISRNLFPQTLVQSGLKAAAEEVVTWCRKQFDNPQLMFYFSGKDVRFDAMVEKHVFRVLQELINNALKHAAASRIDIELVIDVERVWLSVSDNGIGFDNGAVVAGQGLRSMKDRISLMNGNFEMDSQKGRGTTATLEIKLNNVSKT